MGGCARPHLEEQQVGELLDVVAIAHAVVAQGEPGFHASTCVLACRRTGEAPSEPWTVAVVPEFLDKGHRTHLVSGQSTPWIGFALCGFG